MTARVVLQDLQKFDKFSVCFHGGSKCAKILDKGLTDSSISLSDMGRKGKRSEVYIDPSFLVAKSSICLES